MSKKFLKLYDSILGHYAVVKGLKKLHLIKTEERSCISSIRGSVIMIANSENLSEISVPDCAVNARIESTINRSNKWKIAENNERLNDIEFSYSFFVRYDIKISSMLDLKNTSFFFNNFIVSIPYYDNNKYSRKKQLVFSCMTKNSQQPIRSYMNIYSRMFFEACSIRTDGVSLPVPGIAKSNIVNNLSSKSMIIRTFNSFLPQAFMDFKQAEEICNETLSKINLSEVKENELFSKTDVLEINENEVLIAFSNAIKIRELFIFVQNFMSLSLVSITGREEIVRHFFDSYAPEASSTTFDIGFNISNYKFIFMDEILDLVKRVFQYCVINHGRAGDYSIQLENPEVLDLDIVRTMIEYCNSYISAAFSSVSNFGTVNVYGDAKVFQFDFSFFTFDGNKILEKEEGTKIKKVGSPIDVPPLVFEYDEEHLRFKENNLDYPHSFSDHYPDLEVFNFKKMSLLSKGPWSYMGKYPKDFSKKTPEMYRNFSFRTLLNKAALSLEEIN